MKKKAITEVVFILDRSGSMAGLESDTIGGYNALLEKQLTQEGEVRVTTILFDDCYEVLHNRKSLQLVKPLTSAEYFVRGTTALLDAIGKTITSMKLQHEETKVEYKANQFLFVITTDGLENASSEYTYKQVKHLIQEQREKMGWEFIFLGANIDVAEEANRLGIDKERAVKYCNDREGVSQNYEAISEALTELRLHDSISSSWKKKIKKDSNA